MDTMLTIAKAEQRVVEARKRHDATLAEYKNAKEAHVAATNELRHTTKEFEKAVSKLYPAELWSFTKDEDIR